MTLDERRYQSYVRAYEKKQAELAEFGAKMSSPVLDKADYLNLYKYGTVGLKKSKNIPKKIVEQQAREYSPAQAKARAEAMKLRGDIENVRSYAKFKYKEGVNAQFDAELRARYAQLKQEGKYSPKEMGAMLGLEFFYSDEDEMED